MIEPRPGHKPGDSQRIIDGKPICVICDSAVATINEDFCCPCCEEIEVVNV